MLPLRRAPRTQRPLTAKQLAVGAPRAVSHGGRTGNRAGRVQWVGTGLQIYIPRPPLPKFSRWFSRASSFFSQPGHLYNCGYFPLITIFQVMIFKRKQVISICKYGIFNPQANDLPWALPTVQDTETNHRLPDASVGQHARTPDTALSTKEPEGARTLQPRCPRNIQVRPSGPSMIRKKRSKTSNCTDFLEVVSANRHACTLAQLLYLFVIKGGGSGAPGCSID